MTHDEANRLCGLLDGVAGAWPWRCGPLDDPRRWYVQVQVEPPYWRRARERTVAALAEEARAA